jgi:hypothetical protein
MEPAGTNGTPFERENPAIQIVGAQPGDGLQIPGIVKCHKNTCRKIF